MRIAFVYDAVYPWEKGGAQKRVWEISRRLAERHDVHLYGMHYWDGPATIEKEGVTLHGVCEPRDLYVEGRRSITQALSFAGHTIPSLLKADYDVIDCQQFPYFPVFVSKLHELLRNSHVVVTWYEVWGDYWFEYLGRKGVFGKAIEQAVARLPKEVVPISNVIRDDLAGIGRTTGVDVVPNGVDYEGIQNIPAAESDSDIIYVGRLSEHKNVDVLLDAIAIASEQLGRSLHCKIIGDGPERDDLEAHAVEGGVADQVEFLGFVEADADVIAHIKTADVFALPSTREGFPNTILEANACGVPSIIVQSEDNGAVGVVDDGQTGYIVSLAAEEFAQRITEICTDESLRETLRTNVKQFAKEHDWDVIVGELEQVYSESMNTE